MVHSRDEADEQITSSKLSCGKSVSTRAAAGAVHVIVYPAAFINLCVDSDCTCISSSR